MYRAGPSNGNTILEAYTGRGEAPCAKPLAASGSPLYLPRLVLGSGGTVVRSGDVA